MSQVAATCGTCCVVQSRQEKRSRKEKEEEAEEEKKKEDVRRVRRSVRERKTRSKREREGEEEGAITQMFRYTFCGLFCSLATQISGPTVTQAGQRCQVLFTLALPHSLSPSPSPPLSLCLSPLKVKSLPKCEVATLASASSAAS